MRFLVGSDHAAVGLRDALVEHLGQADHHVRTVGPAAGGRADYPDPAAEVARAVAGGEVDRGVLACGTGIGMSIAANKVPGVRAALAHDPVTARLAAAHNDAQVLCLGGRLHAPEYAVEILDAWLGASFEPRHQRRIDKIHALERPGER